MPRFCFNVLAIDGSARDNERHELDGLKAAEYIAIQAAAGISYEVRSWGRPPETYVRVKDEDGFLLLTVDIVSMAVRRTIRALALEGYPNIARDLCITVRPNGK